MIGLGDGLPWDRINSDMKWFRKNTEGKVIVMGRKTWETLGKKLPNRINVVISNKTDIEGPDLVLPCNDQYQFLETLKAKYPDKDIVIIGGRTLYVQFLFTADVIHITTIQAEYYGDVMFDCRRLCLLTYNMIHQEHLPEGDGTPGVIFESFKKIVH